MEPDQLPAVADQVTVFVAPPVGVALNTVLEFTVLVGVVGVIVPTATVCTVPVALALAVAGTVAALVTVR